MYKMLVKRLIEGDNFRDQDIDFMQVNFGEMGNQQLGASLPEINSGNRVGMLTLPHPKISFSGVQFSHIITFIDSLRHRLTERRTA
jgi:hypothetical protein